MLLNRLENYVSQKGLFSDMQFGFKEEYGALKRHSLFLRPSITCLSGEAKSSYAFLTSIKLLTQYGLKVYCINYFQSLESGAECCH